jgi:hypothetical protein
MTKQRWVLLVGSMLGLVGCVAEPGSVESSLGGVCEPTHATPLLDMATGTVEAGAATITTNGDGVAIVLDAHDGWTLGDYYIGIGTSPDTLVWHTVNPQPWITGWVDRLDFTASLADLGVGCGDAVKIVIQGFARDAAGRIQVSALGAYELGAWGWYSYYDICCPPVDAGCTLTQGYWRNHAWPVDSLVLGDRSYSATELRALFGTPVRGDASVSLAHQLIAAELNRASGATPSADLAAAHDWLRANGDALPFGARASSPAGQEAVAIAAALASYNEGSTGPGHCDD